MISIHPPSTLIRDLYARMLFTRIVDDHAWKLYHQGYLDVVTSCRGHEAVQVGSAACIEVGTDFILPYYRDLGVVLTLGMTPYEVFRTYLQSQDQPSPATPNTRSFEQSPIGRHWGYHKHNTVTGPAPVATQLLHAAGIAFSCKLRKAPTVTVAYCGDGATTKPDFLEGMRFASLHQLPIIFVCEQDCSVLSPDMSPPPSCTEGLALPVGLTHQRIDGSDIVSVYSAMRTAMQHARGRQGPILLEMHVTRSSPATVYSPWYLSDPMATPNASESNDPLVRCRQYLQSHGLWDNEWATQLFTRISTEVERALTTALRDTFPQDEKAEQRI